MSVHTQARNSPSPPPGRLLTSRASNGGTLQPKERLCILPRHPIPLLLCQKPAVSELLHQAIAPLFEGVVTRIQHPVHGNLLEERSHTGHLVNVGRGEVDVVLPNIEVGALWFVCGGDFGEEDFDAGEEGWQGAGMTEHEAESRVPVEDTAEVELQKWERRGGMRCVDAREEWCKDAVW